MLSKKFKSVVFCGLAASGKTTIAKNIAKIFKLEYVCAGDLLKNMINEANNKDENANNVKKIGFWESKNGFDFFAKRQNEDNFDRKLDNMLLKLVEEKPIALTSWTLPYLNCNAFKIFIKTTETERAKRMAKRDGISYGQSKKLLQKRDSNNKKLYKKLYGFELGSTEDFDFVLESKNNIDDDVELVKKFLDGVGF